ncbi:MAG: hypothetical protein GWP17_06740 [Aquificales bacterium]|nr:hypothetical protein [Aquificales bacterium]
MPQLHFYVPEPTAKIIKERALESGVSTSKYLAELVRKNLKIHDWPDGFFADIVGGWQGEPLQRSAQGDFDTRDTFDGITEG